MTSKDYYFDSYAHFGIHEVGLHSNFFNCYLWARWYRRYFKTI